MAKEQAYQKERADAKFLVSGVRTVLDQLPRTVFKIGIDQEIAVERMLLSARPDDRPMPDRLTEMLALIGPIVCKTPDQQGQFQRIALRHTQKPTVDPMPRVDDGSKTIRIFRKRQNDAVGRSVGDPAADKAIRKHARRKSRSAAWIALVVVLAFGLGIGLVSQVSLSGTKGDNPPIKQKIPTPDNSPPPNSTGNWALFKNLLSKGWSAPQTGRVGSHWRWLLSMIPLAGAGLVIRRRGKLQRFIERRMTGGESEADDAIRISGIPADLFGEDTRKRLLSLRTPLEQPSGHLDLKSTLRATLRAGGRFVLHFATRRLSSEYLVISRRLTDHSHLDHIGTALVSAMHKEEIQARHYAFWREGVRLVEVREAGGDGAPDRNIQNLASLAARYPDHRLIILDEARHLIGRRGRISSWAEDLRAWPQKIWITPLQRSRWGAGEAAAREIGFHVVSLYDSDPLSGLGKAFAGILESVEPEQEHVAQGEFPRTIMRHAGEFESEDPPPQEMVATLIHELGAYLDQTGFRWLQACAVFPVLEPQLTRHLGNRLHSESGRPLFSLQRFTSLSRLPWFKTGEMPDWLREKMVQGMSGGWRDRVRDTVTEILAPTHVANGGGASIRVVRRYRRRLVHAIAEKMRARPEEEQVRARLLIDFLYQKPSLSFGLPQWLFRGWREVITPDAAVIALMGVLGALVIFGLYDAFTLGISGWLYQRIAGMNASLSVSLLWATGILSMLELAWWTWDVIRQRDIRRRWRPMVMAISTVLLLLTFFTLLFAVSQYSPQLGYEVQSKSGIIPGWSHYLLTLGLLGLLSVYIRAAVAPVLPPRIAVTPLHEGLGRTSLLRLIGRFAAAVVVGAGLVLAFLAATLGTDLQPLIQVDWFYPLSIPFTDRFGPPYLRPILNLPLYIFAFGAVLKPVLGSWKPVRNMAWGGFAGALTAEAVIQSPLLAGRPIDTTSQLSFTMEIVLVLTLAGVVLTLYRHQILKLKPMIWFTASIGVISGSIQWLLTSGISLDGEDLYMYGLLLTGPIFPLACYAALRSGGIKISIPGSLGRILLALFICVPVLLAFLFVGMAMMEVLNLDNAGFIFDLWSVGCVGFLYPLVWMKLTATGLHKANLDWPRVPSAVPWLLTPVLMMLTSHFRLTESLTIDLSGLLLPLSIWLGLRYRKTGYLAFAVGAAPLLMGYYSGPYSSINNPAFYLFCLLCCRGFGHPEWLKRCFDFIRTRGRGTLIYLLLLPAGIFYRLGPLQYGSSGYQLAVLTAFMCGLLRKDRYRFVALASAVAVIAKIAYLLDFPIRFNASDSLGVGYYLDSLMEIMTLWLAAWLGSCLAFGATRWQEHIDGKGDAGMVVVAHNKFPSRQMRNILRLIQSRDYRPRIPWVPTVAYIGVLALACHPITIEIAAPISGLFRDMRETMGVYFIAAYVASIMAGAAMGRMSFGIIAAVGGLIMALEPLLLSPPDFRFNLSETISIRFPVWWLRNLTGFMACAGCVWLGIYLRNLVFRPQEKERKKSARYRLDPDNPIHGAVYQFFRYGKDGTDGYMDRIHYDLGFDRSAGLKLDQMSLWKKSKEDENTFHSMRQAMAQGLDRHCSNIGAFYADEVNASLALEQLSAIFGQGSTSLIQVALLCDRLYRSGAEGAATAEDRTAPEASDKVTKGIGSEDQSAS